MAGTIEQIVKSPQGNHTPKGIIKYVGAQKIREEYHRLQLQAGKPANYHGIAIGEKLGRMLAGMGLKLSNCCIPEIKKILKLSNPISKSYKKRKSPTTKTLEVRATDEFHVPTEIKTQGLTQVVIDEYDKLKLQVANNRPTVSAQEDEIIRAWLSTTYGISLRPLALAGWRNSVKYMNKYRGFTNQEFYNVKAGGLAPPVSPMATMAAPRVVPEPTDFEDGVHTVLEMAMKRTSPGAEYHVEGDRLFMAVMDKTGTVRAGEVTEVVAR